MKCYLAPVTCSRVVIHIVSEVSDAEKFEMLEKYVKVSCLDSGGLETQILFEK